MSVAEIPHPPASDGVGGQPDEIRPAECSERTAKPRIPRPAFDVLSVAVWLALVTGYAEALFWLARQQLLGTLVFKHPGLLWMSPLTQVACFAVPGLLLALVARLKRRWDVVAFSVTLLSLLGWFNLLLLWPGIHSFARIIAACGLAAVTGRVFLKHRERYVRIVRLSVVWLFASVMVIMIVQTGVARHREASAVASLPAAEDLAPNVLLIVLDTVRADALELYGGKPDVAPNICELARQGVVLLVVHACVQDGYGHAPARHPQLGGRVGRVRRRGRTPHGRDADVQEQLQGRGVLHEDHARQRGGGVQETGG